MATTSSLRFRNDRHGHAPARTRAIEFDDHDALPATQHQVAVGDRYQLSECDGRMDWPHRGIYFFRETDENRGDTNTHDTRSFSCNRVESGAIVEE